MRSVFALYVLCLATSAWAFTGEVIRVIDGDTLVFLTPEAGKEIIRLYGIDCPERRQEAECRNNPGELRNTPDYVNARSASEKLATSGRFEKVEEPPIPTFTRPMNK
jgi:endonuclease YncB( thermonuclease family)